jgi:hypothetical protein
VPEIQAKAETKAERADREARKRLEHADMALFDRFMKKLVKGNPPKGKEGAKFSDGGN